jgi:hypothetical protein
MLSRFVPTGLDRLVEDDAFLLDAFVLSNVAFLIADIYVAHSLNDFAHWGEYVPLVYSAAGTAALAVSVWLHVQRTENRPTWIGEAVGWGGVLVGIAGLVWHLEAWFFEAATLKSLVYSAPFVAPLAFVGLGMLLLLNRREEPGSVVWSQWIVFLAWGGWVGNFGLSVIDHAQNGFFYATEWIPVGSSALCVGILAALLIVRPDRLAFRSAFGILLLNVVVGLLGFALHLAPLWTDPGTEPVWDQIVFGPPVFAPLLLVDLAVLGALGVWKLQTALHDRAVAAS